MDAQVVNMAALLAANPDYAKALAKGEPWALKHARRCDSLNAGEPEGFRREFDGKPRKWCGGACISPEGCVVCTLPENPEIAREHRRYKFENEKMNLFDSESPRPAATSSMEQGDNTIEVLLQQWDVPSQGLLYSISKNEKQIATTKRKVEKDNGSPVGSAKKIRIPDGHAFADMIKMGTVFLHPDEMYVLIYE